MKNDAERIGAQIRTLRTARGWTQAELASRAGKHRPLVCRIERGCHMPSLGVLKDYAWALGCPLWDVVKVIEFPMNPAECGTTQVLGRAVAATGSQVGDPAE